MLAVGLCLALFAFWGAVGYAVACALAATAPRNRLQNLLIGPAIGIVLTVTPLFILSRLGVPVRAMALGIVSGLTLITIVLLLWLRPSLPWKRVWPFAAVLALALCLTGRPMFEFGLHWMSYCNDDMANYCLSARWLKDNAVVDAPTPEEITTGTDYSKIYWMLHVPAMSRVGCELIVSWTSTLSGISEHRVFNPVILAFHLALISAAGALVMRSEEHYLAALVACVLISFSAMNSLGTLVQVIAQVGGLAVLMTVATLLLRPFEGFTRGQIVRHGVLIGIVGAGQAILYAEVLPFLFLAFCAYTLAQVVARKRPWGMLGVIGVGLVVSVILLRKHAWTVVTYILVQSAGGSVGDDPLKSLMPYFLVPAGLANLFGFQHITDLSFEPLLSLTIAAGLLLALAAFVAAAWGTWRGHAVAAFTLVMFAVAPYLYAQRTGFGLFKLSMFIQPFLLGTIAVAWLALVRRPVARFVPLAILALSGVFVQQWYVDASRGTKGSFSLIPFATPSRVDAEFERLAERHRGRRMVSDPYNVVLAKFQALHAQGSTFVMPSNDFFRSVMTYKEDLSTAGDANLRRAKEITRAVDSVFTDSVFELHDPKRPGAVNKFHTCRVGGYDGTPGGSDTLLVMSTGLQGIYNRRHLPPPFNYREARTADNFAVVPYDRAQNHLIAIASDLSQPFYAADPTRIGVYQIEREPLFFRGSTMAGLGRYLMFQVVNPSPDFRVTINLTSTYLADRNNALPADAVAIGDGRWGMGATGRGSARLFSPPLVPQRIEGRDYVMLDLGRPGKRFAWPRGGLMSLYGRDVALDRRLLVGFARDVSVVSAGQYAALAPPAKLQRFPDDLALRDLEYSGIYEDNGWCSEHAFAYLSAAAAGPALEKAVVVRGTVPEIAANKAFRTEVKLMVDGVEVARQTLSPGDFELRGMLPAASAATQPSASTQPAATGSLRRRVELQFSDWQNLPDDGRPVAAQLKLLGIVEATPADRGLAQR